MQALVSSTEQLKSDILTPHLVSVGSPFSSRIFYIFADGQPILRVADIIEGVLLLLVTYFDISTEYPPKCRCTYSFLQEKVLLQANRRAVPKLVRFIEKLID